MADQQPTHAPPDGVTFRLAILAALLTIGLTAVTFWLSYEALHNLAAGHDLEGARAWAWPATIDTFIVIGEVLILRASLLHRVDWLAILLTAAGSIGSIVLNVASAGEVGLMTKCVAGVPPCAALLIFTALMRQIYRALALHMAEPVEQPVEAVVERVGVPPVPVAPPALPAVEQARPVEEQPTPVVEQPVEPEPLVYADARCHAVRPLYDAGHRPGTAAMRAAIIAAGYPRPSDSVIRGSIRAEVEQHEPRLRDLPAEATPLHRAG